MHCKDFCPFASGNAYAKTNGLHPASLFQPVSLSDDTTSSDFFMHAMHADQFCLFPTPVIGVNKAESSAYALLMCTCCGSPAPFQQKSFEGHDVSTLMSNAIDSFDCWLHKRKETDVLCIINPATRDLQPGQTSSHLQSLETVPSLSTGCSADVAIRWHKAAPNPHA